MATRLVKTQKPDKTERKMIFTSKLVEDITNRINEGVHPKRFENPWLKSEIGVRRSGIAFKMSSEEQDEYIKCALNVSYFAETYCKVKTEDGSINNINLRDYQHTMFENLYRHRFNILMCSRQTGKTITSSIFLLHTVLFNNDKNIMIVANKRDTTIEITDKIKSIYTLLPFFLKPGVKVWNQTSITFDNGCKIKTAARTKSPAIGFTIDVLYLDEFAHIPSNIIVPYYTAAFPTVSAITNSKIIISSTPKGMNLFHKLLTDAERPEGDPLKNNYKALRVYWHQVPGRFVTYIKLNEHLLYNNDITKEEVYDKIKEVFNPITKTEMIWNLDLQKNVINIYNNEVCSTEDIRQLKLSNEKNKEISICALGEISTWKEEAIKDIGGEDAFNQEYGLRFIDGSRSLLTEEIIDNLMKQKENYIFKELSIFEKLKFSYRDLKWIDNEKIFIHENRKQYKYVISVDLSEGLGQDYSVINIFKIGHKPKELILKQLANYTSITNYFRLEQVGIFRSNIISIKQVAELLYLLVFEYLNPDEVKIVLELNTYGNTLLAELPHVFEGKNDYGSSVFVRFKHRVDSNEEKIGLKIGDNKNILVKKYQDLMSDKSFYITNEETISEVTTFVKQITSAGNVKYAADIGHDDCTMTIVDATAIFDKVDFKEMVNEYMEKHMEGEMKTFINECLKKSDYFEALDYTQVLNIRKRYVSTKYTNEINKVNNSWFYNSGRM